ncbi:MAG: F0F1 ATP synthase subunit gamma [Gammaproteobacteria bacterium]|jgi:F-type H+-transporting ATPase subunit gamma|nr:F0F1 ATP synthase subunit gamma [Gammaproteobacteria bacterium]
MATAKEIKSRIRSIESTKKITRAMELIAASKLRKARDRVEASKPYAARILEVISHIANAKTEYNHPYLAQRDVKRIGILLVSTDRGLCGGLNNHLFKKALQQIKIWQSQNIEIDVALIGHKAELFFKRLPVKVVAYAHHLGDAPTSQDIIGSVRVMLDAFVEGKIDELHLFSNTFINTIKQTPKSHLLLPVGIPEDQRTSHWDYIYEPDAKSLLTLLLERYVESMTYQGVVENIACEQASRMMAMKNASDNATEVIDELKLDYNKARQALITKELSEIVSGSEAI